MLITVWLVTFVLIIGIGVYVGSKIQGANQWSGGDKSLSAFGVGALLGAFQIGGMAIVGAAQNGYVLGIGGSWYSIASPFYIILIAIFAKLIRDNMPGDSLANFLEERYSARCSRLYSYIWVILGFIYIPIQLKTIASVIRIVLPGMSMMSVTVLGLAIAAVYTGFAGLKGASAIGKVICVLTYVLLAVFVFINLPKFDGYSGLVEMLPENFGNMSNMPTQRWVAWAIGGVLSTSVMQTVLQPVIAAKDAGACRKGCMIGYIFSAPICIITAIIGMMARASTDTLGDGATAFAWAIREYSGPVFAGITFAVATLIIAATMASMMLGTGTILTNIYRTQVNPKATDTQILKFSRWATVLFSFSTLIPAFLIPSASLTTMFLTVVYVASGPVSFSVFAGLLWKRANEKASFLSMIFGVIVGIVWVAFGMVDKLDSIYPIIIVSYSVGITVTLLTGRKRESVSS